MTLYSRPRGAERRPSVWSQLCHVGVAGTSPSLPRASVPSFESQGCFSPPPPLLGGWSDGLRPSSPGLVQRTADGDPLGGVGSSQ